MYVSLLELNMYQNTKEVLLININIYKSQQKKEEKKMEEEEENE